MFGASERADRFGIALLLASIFVVAGCAIVYELLIGSLSSYFLGDSVEQFSLTIGFFLAAMGVGSWVSRWFKRDLLPVFIAVELLLGLIGGLAVALLYLLYTHAEYYRLGMVLMILVIGGLVGLELPLLARLLKRYGSLRTTLSNVLSMDYLGALAAALLFPYVLLPFLGNLHAGLLAGLINTAVGGGILGCFWGQLSGAARRGLSGLCLGSLFVLGAVWSEGQSLLDRWESRLYADRIIYSVQSPYQKIVLTRWQDDVRLYLDGHLQFAAVDEYRYHEALVHPAMALAKDPKRVLIVGGGDGLSAREVLKYPSLETVDLVDLDPEVTRLGRRHPELTRLNDNALSRRPVAVYNEDAFTFLQRAHPPYDVIIIDLPDPREEALTKLYSVEGYKMFRRQLAPGGALVTQATSPYYARETYWSIAAALEEAGFGVLSYHLNVPTFGEWGFHLAAAQAPLPGDIDFSVERRYLMGEVFAAMCVFPPDMARVEVTANRLNRPDLARRYRSEWARW